MSASLMGDNSPGVIAKKKKFMTKKEERRKSLKDLSDSIGLAIAVTG